MTIFVKNLAGDKSRQSEIKNKRFKEVDALRGLGVLLMVFSHGLRWVYAGDPLDIIEIFGHTPGDIATPMFYLAAGLALYFSLERRLLGGVDLLSLRKEYSMRLGKLFLIGVSMSFPWGVLQAQAVTLFILVWVALSLIKKHNLNSLRSLFPGMMLLALLLHFLLPRGSLSILGAEIFAGQFPLFAILFINATGFYFAPYLRSRLFSLGCGGLGLGLVIIALLLSEKGVPVERCGASISFLFLGMGLSVFLLGIFHTGLYQKKSSILRYLTIIGRDALFIFIFHYVVFFLPLYIFGLLGSMTATGALMFAGVVVAGTTVTAVLRRDNTLSVYNMFDIVFSMVWPGLSAPRGKQLHNPGRRKISYPREAGARSDS